jgi:NitT/TauT family transport system permease protein
VAPKAVIAMYLCFFPVTVAMVQGLRSPQVIETEMMHTYAASRWQALWMLRLPQRCRFCSRPAGRHCRQPGGRHGGRVAHRRHGGLGARLLTGSYYGNTWASGRRWSCRRCWACC